MSSIRTKKNIVELKEKSLIKIGILAAVLVIFCIASFFSVDRTAPVFDFTGAASVLAGASGNDIDYDTLIKGVKATDRVDGDLTDSIIIKSARRNADSSMSVIYSVRDHSGNVASEERIINLPSDSAKTDVKPTESEPASPEAPESGDESSSEPDTESPEESSLSDEENGSDVPSDIEPSAEDTQPEPVVPPSSGSEKPVIILNTTEAHVPVGGPFNYPSYIQEMWDDVDSQDFLYQSIWIENYELVDWSKPGVYTLIFRIVDSDKNISDGQVLTLYVE